MGKYLPEKRFSFTSDMSSLDEETFGVVQVKGVEGISIPYEFEIMLVSDESNIDLEEVLAMPARFTIHREQGGDIDFRGMLAELEQLHKYNKYVFYRAFLVPRLWWLSLTHHNQVCLNKTVPEIVELALNDAGLTSLDFEFKLQRTYEKLDYVCQYNESHLQFISRWLEREGIYYYFDQSGPVEKILFTDTYIAHTDFRTEGTVLYAPPSGLEPDKTEIVQTFTCRLRQLPQRILLKDHNYQRPSLGLSGVADVDERGRGTDYLYGEHFPNSEEGDRLAKIHAEALNCRKREFVGESTIPFIEPGYTFTLKNHYRDSFNCKYLVEGVSHDGNQVGYLIPEISSGLPGYKNNVYYRNSFSAIPSEVQYRPERKTVKPRISGTLHAVIDAEGSGQYAELDNQGRYKVRLPFDINDEHKDGKASAYLRMMQPYANQKGGMQFPLTKGTEVLLTFIDGDPDRPVIAGAVANPETPSPVSSKNQTESVIQTGGNNKIRMEDKNGKERIIMESPTSNSWVRIGAPNDPPDSCTVMKGENVSSYIDSSGTWSLGRLTIDTNDMSNNGKTLTYTLQKDFTVSWNGTGYSIGNESLGASLKTGDEYTIASIKWKLSGRPASTPKSTQNLQFQRTKDVVLNIKLPVLDQDDADGIKIKTSGDLVEQTDTNFRLIAGETCNEQIGVTTTPDTTHAFTSNPKKGTFVKGNNELYVEGKNDIIVTQDCTIRAMTGGSELKIEMKNGELLIDAGSSNIVLKGNKIEQEIGPEPPDPNSAESQALLGSAQADATIGVAEASATLFKGSASVTILGTSFEYTGGESAEVFVGANQSLALAASLEASLAESLSFFLGAKQEFSLSESFAFTLGLKQEITIAAALAISLGSKSEFFSGTQFSWAKGTKIELSPDAVKIEWDAATKKFKLAGTEISSTQAWLKTGGLSLFL